jgi:DtxR family Mn-dependent transcriptional regulator
MSILEILRRYAPLLRSRGQVRLDDALKRLQHGEMSGQAPSLESLAGALGCGVDQAARLLAELQSQGLVLLSGGMIQLTGPGRERALHLVRAHRLWERFLADRTGFDELEWHELAERREHELSQAQADRLSASLGHPTHDPHGDPIPSAEGEWAPQPGILLPAARPGQRLQVVHIEDEPEGLFAELLALGLHPGAELRLLRAAPEWLRLEIAGETRRLSALAAGNVTVLELPPAEGLAGTRLSALPVGQSARVIALLPACHGADRRRLQDLGLLPGTQVRAEFASPAGDPVAYRIRGALIALRKEQADLIQVERAPA